MKELLQEMVDRVYVSKGEEYIKFVREWYNGHKTLAIYGTEGDCCSETWFADIVGLDSLLHHEIVAIEVIPYWEPEDNRTRQDSDKAYGYKLRTGSGITDIIFRNSSNGYYGGDIFLYKGEKEPDVEWVEITKDWSAPGSTGE
jgi:hypothetical protein